jgi:hypothetical protein
VIGVWVLYNAHLREFRRDERDEQVVESGDLADYGVRMILDVAEVFS